MKALVIAPQPFFTPRGTPFSVYYRTLVLGEKGVAVDFVTYGEGRDVDLPGVRILRGPRLAFLGPVKVGPSWKKLVLDVFLTAQVLGLLCRRRYDFVHAHEEAVFLCALLKPLFRFRLVYDMHSSLPQQLTNFSFTRSRFLIGLFRRLEDRSIRVASAIITICPDLAEYVRGQGVEAGRHFLIENSIFDPVRLKGESGSAAAVTLPDALPEGKRYIVYAGTLEAYQGIDILIGALPRVLERAPDAFLVIVGGDAAQVAHYRALAQRAGVGGACLVRERVPQAVAREYTRRAHVQVSPRSAGTNTPLKVYEQLASGVPLVATRIHSHTQVLDDAVAYLAAPESSALAEAVVQALRDGREGNPKAAAARRLYEEKYSRPAYEGKIDRLLERLRTCAG